MDPDTELLLDFPPFFKRYKSGRVERLMGADFIPPSTDTTTGVSSKDITINPNTSITARLFLPKLTTTPSTKLPILVYFHGGAFLIGSAFNVSYHNFLNSLVSKANIIAVSVNYRLAPEHLLPTAYEDSWEALQWVLSSGASEEPWLADHGDLKRVFLAGDSAGANIAHQMALRVKNHELLGIILIHPYFWGSEAVGEETRDAKERPFMEGLWKMACSQEVGEVDHPFFNPLKEERLAALGCGKVMVLVAGKDVLRERGRVYCEKLKESGWEGYVELHESEGEEHVFHLNKPDCEKALAMMDKVVAFINAS